MKFRNDATLCDLLSEGFNLEEEEIEGEPHIYVRSLKTWHKRHRRILREAGFKYSYYPVTSGFLPGWAYKLDSKPSLRR